MDMGTRPEGSRGGLTKALAGAVLACVAALALHGTAAADTGTQRFHVVYAGPLQPGQPPTSTVIASGLINGKGYERVISQGPGPQPNTNEFVFPDGSLRFSWTATFEHRFIAAACVAINSYTGHWTITGGTGAYAGATGEGVLRGHNVISGDRTSQGCTEPDRAVSNVHGVGTITVPALLAT